MENEKIEPRPVNQKAQDYFNQYATKAKKIPIYNINHLGSIFDTSRTALDDISIDNVIKWLKNPNKFAGRLIETSLYLYKNSGEYRSLINYFATMARFNHVFDPLFSHDTKMNKKQALKDLSTLSLQLNKMNIKHEFSKIIKTCLLEDVFFGYEIEDNNNYFILKLDPRFCRISGIVDGMYTFDFNLAYFKGNEQLLVTYPLEFQEAYRVYQLEKSNYTSWIEVNIEKSVCFKFNEDIVDVIPPFSVMFERLLELNDYKKLKKVGAKINNYMLLHQKVPMHDNNKSDYQTDNFAISTEAMEYFNEMVNENLPEEIGAIVSPMEINSIDLNKDDKTDKVAEATRDVYNSSGVSNFLFNNDKNSTGGLLYSTRKDELLIINFYRQLERWLNRKIRFGNLLSGNQWKISLLDVTGMSEDKYLEQLTKSGSFGFAVRGRIAAMHGQDYHSLLNALELENDVLDLDTKMVPLASSHTGGLNTAIEQKANEDKGGRPVKSSDEISDSGQANKDSGAIKGGEKQNV